jgi:iron complex outermembrane receptor protein
VAGLQLGLNYGYLHAEWTDRTVGGLDLDGEPLSTPRQRAAFIADYNWALGNAGSLLFHFDYSWTSKRLTNIASPDYLVDYQTKEDALKLSNARLAWQPPAAAWQLALWAENLLDTEYVVNYNGIASDLDSPYVRRNTPRFFGAEVIYSW